MILPPSSTFEALFESILYDLLTHDRIYIIFDTTREATTARRWWSIYTGDRNIPTEMRGRGRLRIFSIRPDKGEPNNDYTHRALPTDHRPHLGAYARHLL